MGDLYNYLTQEEYPFAKNKNEKICSIKQRGFLFNFTEEAYNLLFSNEKSNFANKNLEDYRKMNNKNLSFTLPKNQILYGPPGTGKTYNTIIKAMDIINPKLVQRDKDGNVEKYNELKTEFDKLKQQGQIEFVTFHQSYSYEEFVEGIKPDISKWNDDGSDIKYVGKDGIFKNIAKKALFSHLNILASDDEKFKNIIKCFIDDNSEGSKFKTQYSEFEIVRYTQTAIIVEPCNGKTEYNLTFNNLEKLYRNKQDVKTRKDIEQILGWRGLSTYYLAILNKLKDYSEKNITNIQTNSNEDSIIIKSIDDYLQEYYEGNLTLKEEPKKYILIIDEINRGDVSKIFGELITLIEEDKRIGKEHQMTVTLPYSREPFGVPNNLYIIGTMNTADRSIALLDTALRRRFDFEEMMPKPELLSENVEGVDLAQLLTQINDRIKQSYRRSKAIVSLYQTGSVCVRRNDIRNFQRNRIIQQNNFFISNAHKRTDLQNQCHNNGRQYAWYRYMYHPLNLACSVHFSGLIKFRTDPRQSGKVDDCRPSEALPYSAGNKYGAEPFGFHQEIDGFSAQSLNNHIHDSRAGREKINQHSADNYGGNKVGDITDRLNHPFIHSRLQIVRQ